VLNTVDRVATPALLPLIDHYRTERDFAEIVPISALDGTSVDRLEALLLAHVPEGPPLYPDAPVADAGAPARMAELVREQVLRLTRDELPYSTAVVVERVEAGGSGRPTVVYGTILVERESQKRIVVGRAGATVRAIGTAARQELEQALGSRVFLDLHVKVKADWREDDRFLDELLPE